MQFKKKQSLVLRLTSTYLLLILINIIIFWLMNGSNQMRLLTEKSLLRVGHLSLQIQQKLNQDFKNQKVALNKLSIKKQKRLLKKIEHSLNEFKTNQFAFALIYDNTEVLENNSEIFSKEDKKQIIQNSFKARLIKEKTNTLYYLDPNLKKYQAGIYIPFQWSAKSEVLLYIKVPFDEIKTEFLSLIKLAFYMVLILLVIQTVFGIFLYYTLVSPIKKLLNATRNVSEGDLDSQLKIPARKDELAELTVNFNEMVMSLNKRTTQLKVAHDKLDLKDQVIQKELGLARNIQSCILPERTVLPEWLQLGLIFEPLEKISGDYYDFFKKDENSISILLADASGHGIPAALMTMMARFYFNDLVNNFDDPGDLFAEINKEMTRSVTTTDYLTAFFCHISRNGEMKYCNASHPSPLIYRSGEIIELDEEKGFILGAMKRLPVPYVTRTLQLEKGDRLIIFTDGITETSNVDNDLYGLELLKKKILASKTLSSQDLADQIILDVKSFAAEQDASDDSTLLILDYN